jgi:hypothetical protein
MKCDKCIHADWLRTATGRLSPSKQGQCRWNLRVELPPSVTAWGLNVGADRVLVISGGYIDRGSELRRDCPAYAEAQP